MRRQADAKRAKALAADYLQARGLRLIKRNYSCRLGEIDLILSDGRYWCSSKYGCGAILAFGGAAASITAAKRQRILRAARHYLQAGRNAPCRFDVILLDALDRGPY